jgi:hypothetical protein
LDDGIQDDSQLGSIEAPAVDVVPEAHFELWSKQDSDPFPFGLKQPACPEIGFELASKLENFR